jgi:O-antigen/teichoic acid export membrane protein
MKDSSGEQLKSHFSNKRASKAPRIRSVKFNVLMNMILTSSAVIFPLITVPYVSRVLLTYGTGAVAFVQGVVSYFSLVALLGMTNYGVRACARVRDDPYQLSKTVKELLIILGISTTIVTIGYLLAVMFVPRFHENQDLFFAFGIVLWLASFGVEWFYQALEQYGYITVRNLAIKIVGIILMFVFVRSQQDYFLYGLIVIFSGYGANIFNMLRLRKLVDLSVHTPIQIGRHIKPMGWFFVATVSSGMYVQADLVILGLLGTTNMVGLYQLVAKVKGTMVNAVNSVGNVMLPRLTYYTTKQKKDKVRNLTAKNINFVMILSCFLIGVCLLSAPQIVLILGGKAFAESALPLKIVSFAALFSALNIVLENYLVSNSKEITWALINVAGLVVAVISNCVLIPKMGVSGAALSIVLCELFVLGIKCVLCRRFLRELLPNIDPLRIIAVTAISSSAVSFAQSFIGDSGPVKMLFLTLVSFMVIFGLLLLLVRERFITPIFMHSVQAIRRHLQF